MFECAFFICFLFFCVLDGKHKWAVDTGKKKTKKEERKKGKRRKKKPKKGRWKKDGHDSTTRNAERIRERDGTKRVGREREMRKER